MRCVCCCKVINKRDNNRSHKCRLCLEKKKPCCRSTKSRNLCVDVYTDEDYDDYPNEVVDNNNKCYVGITGPRGPRGPQGPVIPT
jgi:hypothetical protein